MNVYVESNFVLEQALEQEQCESCEQLVRLASTGCIRLVIPAFSLAEPHVAISGKQKARIKLGNELQAQLFELGRSRPYREAPGNFSELTAFLIQSAERERAGLQQAIRGLLKAAHVIPLDSDVLHKAEGIQSTLDMSAQDAIVLASIVSHLAATRPGESCFLNRNTKDFDNPNVREMLDAFSCKFLARFDEGLKHIEARLRKEQL